MFVTAYTVPAMRYRDHRITIALFVTLAVARVSIGQEVRIEIKSSWEGLGKPSHGEIVISGNHGKYTSNGHRVASQAVDALLTALEKPVVDKPEIGNCGINESWLAGNFAEGLEQYTHQKINLLSPKQVELFRSKFEDPQAVQEALDQLSKQWHTDDDPEMSVSISRDGKMFGVKSESQNPFMLPWFGTDQSRGGYNCHIGQAIAAILPKGFPNRERLLPGAAFRWDLTSQIMQTIEHEWNMLDTEYKIGAAVAPVFARFRPIYSALSCISSIDLDNCRWNAKLNDPDLPTNFIIGVSLSYTNSGHTYRLVGTDEFLKKIPEYIALVQSVPWFPKYLQDHPASSIELRFVGDRSLSPKALAALTKDLSEHNKSELAARVSKDARGSAFLEINSGSGMWSRAVAFPNREILIWHFQGNQVLGFASNEEIWDYLGWKSTGILVNPNGSLER